MSGVISLTILLVIYAASEYVSRKTNGIIDTVLTISVLALIGFWTGILPKNLFSNSGVEEFGMAIVGLMLTSLGTTINLTELKRQWKVVVIAILGAIGSCVLIVAVALLVKQKNFGVVGAPIFAGGNAATLTECYAGKEYADAVHLRPSSANVPKHNWNSNCYLCNAAGSSPTSPRR